MRASNPSLTAPAVCELEGPVIIGEITSKINENNVVQIAVGSIFGKSLSSMIVAICLFFFGFSTILSWNLFGKTNILYLFKNISQNKSKLIYTILALFFIMIGSLVSSKLVWGLSDMFNNLMVIPNVIALFALTNIVISVLKKSD